MQALVSSEFQNCSHFVVLCFHAPDYERHELSDLRVCIFGCSEFEDGKPLSEVSFDCQLCSCCQWEYVSEFVIGHLWEGFEILVSSFHGQYPLDPAPFICIPPPMRANDCKTFAFKSLLCGVSGTLLYCGD